MVKIRESQENFRQPLLPEIALVIAGHAAVNTLDHFLLQEIKITRVILVVNNVFEQRIFCNL